MYATKETLTTCNDCCGTTAALLSVITLRAMTCTYCTLGYTVNFQTKVNQPICYKTVILLAM